MSILNRTNDGFFNILIVIYHTTLESGTLDRDTLLKRCAPVPLDPKDVGNTLNCWIRLGLFNSSTDENSIKISIPEKYRLKKKQSPSSIARDLPKILREIVFAETNNDNFWNSEESKSADFTRALSWLLCQDIYTIETKNHDQVSMLETKQLGENAPQLIVKNDTRWSGLREWSLALGFAWESGQLVIDPTVAIRESLPFLFKKKETLTIKDFLKKISEALPVLDNGKYRLQVEEIMDVSQWKKPEAKHLSMSLSRAIKRLEAGSIIRCESRSDSGDNFMFLTGRSGSEWGQVTHITCI